MNTDLLKECLQKAGKQELGIPVLLPSFGQEIPKLFSWALQGSPLEGRQLWFCVGNAKEVLASLPGEARGRILPLDQDKYSLIMKRGPYDALLLPKHGLEYGDPSLLLTDFWRKRGTYILCEEFQSEELNLWFWKPYLKTVKLFGMDHHHAVLWDAKKILRPLGIQLDFVWLSDGRQPVNEAIPSQMEGFLSSLDIYKAPLEKQVADQTKEAILSERYDGVITSHSLVTCYRLQNLDLPMIHINSTRFGNEWIQHPHKHETLVQAIQGSLRNQRLHIVHNNNGDRQYLHQYIPSIQPNQELVIPSLCENLLRLRRKTPSTLKLLIWDTRQVLIQGNKSPFMKELYAKAKDRFDTSVESQAILLAQRRGYLPEGYLDDYSAVIHIPYNVSTMSMFEHVRANIPIWVPSKRLLKELWSNPLEPNELSWTVFVSGSEAQASTMDHVRDPEVLERWLQTADFYNRDVLPLVFEFDSIEELLEKAWSTDYQGFIDSSELKCQEMRENIFYAWEQVIHTFRQ
jgi:hypothetical protein